MYGDAVSYFIDLDKPLSEQEYADGQTWADYLTEVTYDNMRQVTALYNEAVKNGYTLTEEDQATIDSSISNMEMTALSYGYQTLDAFLSANYGGKGVDTKLYRDIATKTTIAYSYATQVSEGYTYTDDQLKAYYAEHANDLDAITYEYYFISSSNEKFADLADDDAKIAAAHDAAAEIANAATKEEFDAAIKAFGGEDAAAATDHGLGADMTESFKEWLLDANRAEGDATVIDSVSASFAVRFVDRSKNDYNMVNMRHILVQAEADEDGNYSDEALAAAEAEANEIFAEWKKNPTEENFAALANEKTDDSGSDTTGGLYENVAHYNMVEGINDFLFNSNAKPGDCAVVYGNNGSYAGYHVVYYVSDSGIYADLLAENRLRNADYESFVSALEESYTVSTGAGLKFADLD
ncbi:MAG: peptidylprolyl isomerase, partial [Clostridia bacterium]|nr:peptidylprolyl isomerase [Clostridia bacterium]